MLWDYLQEQGLDLFATREKLVELAQGGDIDNVAVELGKAVVREAVLGMEPSILFAVPEKSTGAEQRVVIAPASRAPRVAIADDIYEIHDVALVPENHQWSGNDFLLSDAYVEQLPFYEMADFLESIGCSSLLVYVDHREGDVDYLLRPLNLLGYLFGYLLDGNGLMSCDLPDATVFDPRGR